MKLLISALTLATLLGSAVAAGAETTTAATAATAPKPVSPTSSACLAPSAAFWSVSVC